VSATPWQTGLLLNALPDDFFIVFWRLAVLNIFFREIRCV
jgi:hypothetical protein